MVRDAVFFRKSSCEGFNIKHDISLPVPAETPKGDKNIHRTMQGAQVQFFALTSGPDAKKWSAALVCAAKLGSLKSRT